jgi:hypothetical protein
MPQNASLDYGASRKPDQLSDGDRQRLRELSRRRGLSADEGFELGALRARARTTQAGRQVLEDANHSRPAPGSAAPSRISEATMKS